MEKRKLINIICPYDIITKTRYVRGRLIHGPKALIAKGTKVELIYPMYQIDDFEFIVKHALSDVAEFLRFSSKEEAIKYGWHIYI